MISDASRRESEVLDRLGQMADRIQQIERKLQALGLQGADSAPAGFAAWLQQQAISSSGATHAHAGTVSRGRFDALIGRIAATHGMDPDLVHAVVKAESNYNPDCVSSAGARGLMQLMPATGRHLGVTDSFDPEQNLDGGVRYLKQQIERFGDLRLALAAYNAGPGAVTQYNGIPPYRETQAYVPRVIRYYQERKAQGAMGLPAAGDRSPGAVGASATHRPQVQPSAVANGHIVNAASTSIQPAGSNTHPAIVKSTQDEQLPMPSAQSPSSGTGAAPPAPVAGGNSAHRVDQPTAHEWAATASGAAASEAERSARPEGHAAPTARTSSPGPVVAPSQASPARPGAASSVQAKAAAAGADAGRSVADGNFATGRDNPPSSGALREVPSPSSGKAASDDATVVQPSTSAVGSQQRSMPVPDTASADLSPQTIMASALQTSASGAERSALVNSDPASENWRETRTATVRAQLHGPASVPVTTAVKSARTTPVASWQRGATAMTGGAQGQVHHPPAGTVHSAGLVGLASGAGQGPAVPRSEQQPSAVAAAEQAGDVAEGQTMQARPASGRDAAGPQLRTGAASEAAATVQLQLAKGVSEQPGRVVVELSDVRGVKGAQAADGNGVQPPMPVAGQVFEALQQPLRELTAAAAIAAQAGQPSRRMEGQQIGIELSPPELGRVHVRLGLDENGVTLHVRAETMMAAMHLDSSFRILEGRLEQMGLRLAGLQVSCDASGGSAMGHEGHARGEAWTDPSVTSMPLQLPTGEMPGAGGIAAGRGRVAHQPSPLAHQRRVLDAVA